jgi:hypothetical protein
LFFIGEMRHLLALLIGRHTFELSIWLAVCA